MAIAIRTVISSAELAAELKADAFEMIEATVELHNLLVKDGSWETWMERLAWEVEQLRPESVNKCRAMLQGMLDQIPKTKPHGVKE